ncbi:hypothetical protein EVAR_21384_1 [Eumeta japonica]|uniref:RNA-directed DNA polymerase from mobile element jockey n=1 Tax=Eumeta variegata TaxID=151549 RepID=A0A4C1VH04_EUMVA|nr:hypothetical protein EVAR_21384_1 [Eumeta japonica]
MTNRVRAHDVRGAIGRRHCPLSLPTTAAWSAVITAVLIIGPPAPAHWPACGALLTGSQRIVPYQLRLRGQAMEWKTCVRYLGVHIYRSLRMVPQVDYVIQMNRAARAKLRSILASRLPIRTKIAINKCYIRSRLTYAASAYYALCSELQRQHQQVHQNIVLRMIAEAGGTSKMT